MRSVWRWGQARRIRGSGERGVGKASAHPDRAHLWRELLQPCSLWVQHVIHNISLTLSTTAISTVMRAQRGDVPCPSSPGKWELRPGSPESTLGVQGGRAPKCSRTGPSGQLHRNGRMSSLLLDNQSCLASFMCPGLATAFRKKAPAHFLCGAIKSPRSEQY